MINRRSSTMKMKTILLVFLILISTGVTGVTAITGDPGGGMGQQLQNQTPAQGPDSLQDVQNQTQSQAQGPEQAQNRTQEQLGEQERLQDRTQSMDATRLQQRLQERKQEQLQEQAELPAERQRVLARYSNVSAFVHVLSNESQSRELLGEGPGGIGPQVSEYAREFNNSLQAQIRAEERIESRNAFVRFLVGGDEEAVGTLEQETIRNQERIQEM